MKVYLKQMYQYTQQNLKAHIKFGVLYFIIVFIQPFIQPFVNKYIFMGIEYNSMKMVLLYGFILVIIISVHLWITYLINSRADTKTTRTSFFQSIPNILNQLYTMPYDKVKEKFSDGDLMVRINEGVTGIISLSFIMIRIISTAICIVLVSILMVDIDVTFIFLSIIIAVIDILFLWISIRIDYHAEKKLQINDSERESQLYTLIDNMDFLQMNHIEDIEKQKYSVLRDDYWRIHYKKTVWIQVLDSFREIMAYIGQSILFVLIRPIYLTQEIGIAAVATILATFNSLREAVVGITNNLTLLPRAVAPANLLMELTLSDELKPIDRSLVENSNGENAIVVLEKVNYQIEDKLLIRDISLSIYKGQKVAIIGKNGCGKSTLLRIILGFYGARGKIEIESSSDMFLSYAPAKSQLFSETVLENIQMGIHDNNKKDDYIYKLVDKVMLPNKILNQDATKLSGGQMQRVNLARAISSDSDLLILDEPTASLDNNLSMHVMNEILINSKTTIAVLHDPNLLHLFDRIIVLDKGQIVFDGELSEAVNTSEYQSWVSN